MKRIIFAVMLFCTTIAQAQNTMKDLWLSMPDSVLPYLNESMRRDHIDFLNMNMSSKVKNLLNGKSVMDSLTTDYCVLHLNDILVWQLILLPRESQNDSIVCSIKTFMGKGSDSEICFYNSNWQRLDESFGLFPFGSLADQLNSFTQKPDTMTQDRFLELQNQMAPCMIEANFDYANRCLVLSLNSPLTEGGNEEQIKAILKQRKFKWNGETFIES